MEWLKCKRQLSWPPRTQWLILSFSLLSSWIDAYCMGLTYTGRWADSGPHNSHSCCLFLHHLPVPMVANSLISAIGGIAKVNVRNDDDIADRLHHRYTVFFFVIFTVVVSTTQYVGDPIHCWCPAYFTSNHEGFTNKVNATFLQSFAKFTSMFFLSFQFNHCKSVTNTRRQHHRDASTVWSVLFHQSPRSTSETTTMSSIVSITDTLWYSSSSLP